MPVDNLSGGTLSIFNATTNQKLCDLDNVKDVSVEEDISYDYYKVWSLPKSSKMTMEVKMDTPIDFNKFLCMDFTQFPDIHDIQYSKVVPVRKHKKKRINKKWLKRYGYKEVVIKSKGWKINCRIDGTVEFVKDGEY